MLISGCVKPGAVELSEADRALLDQSIEIDLFSARGFLGGSDYERYHLKDDVVWRECGQVAKVRRERKSRERIEGDEVFSEDQSLVLEQRRAELLSAPEQVEIRRATRGLLNLTSSDKPSLPQPGSVTSLAGPGLLELNVSLEESPSVPGETKPKRMFVTSVDAVADHESEVLQSMHALVAAIRGVGPVICESPTFFSIPRKTATN